MKIINCLVPAYGSNRTNAAKVGELLAGCNWVGVVFAGGLSEVPHIKARTVVVNDAHRQLINLGEVVKNQTMKSVLIDRLVATLFHPDVLAHSQKKAIAFDGDAFDIERPDLEAAYYYFVCSWMGRNGKALTAGEFKSGLSMRWEAGGGDSCVRFRNATAALAEWHQVTRRCSFSVKDCFDFLKECKDEDGHGVYCDPPWPDDGYMYRHAFGEVQQCRLAEDLAHFRRAKVVVRFGDHSLIRKLYPEDDWQWHHVSGRTASNSVKREVLLVRTPKKKTTFSAFGAASHSPDMPPSFVKEAMASDAEAPGMIVKPENEQVIGQNKEHTNDPGASQSKPLFLFRDG